MCINRIHDIISVSSCISNNPLKLFTCNLLQIDVLYQGPPVMHYELCLSISYCNCSCVSIIHNIPTSCNIVFNTKVVIISYYVVLKLSTSIIIYFLQLIYLITFFLMYFLNFPWTTPTYNLKY